MGSLCACIMIPTWEYLITDYFFHRPHSVHRLDCAELLNCCWRLIANVVMLLFLHITHILLLETVHNVNLKSISV